MYQLTNLNENKNKNVRFVFNPRMHLWWNLGVQEPEVMTKMPPKVILDVC